MAVSYAGPILANLISFNDTYYGLPAYGMILIIWMALFVRWNIFGNNESVYPATLLTLMVSFMIYACGFAVLPALVFLMVLLSISVFRRIVFE